MRLGGGITKNTFSPSLGRWQAGGIPCAQQQGTHITTICRTRSNNLLMASSKGESFWSSKLNSRASQKKKPLHIQVHVRCYFVCSMSHYSMLHSKKKGWRHLYWQGVNCQALSVWNFEDQTPQFPPLSLSVLSLSLSWCVALSTAQFVDQHPLVLQQLVLAQERAHLRARLPLQTLWRSPRTSIHPHIHHHLHIHHHHHLHIRKSTWRA